MKRFLSALLLLTTGVASADTQVGVFGGLNMATDWSAESKSLDVSLSSENGFVVGMFVGMPIAPVPGLSAELEISYRNNQTTGHRTLKGEYEYVMKEMSPTIDLTGDDSTHAFMGNLRYTHRLFDGFSGHVLGGVGYGARRITIEPVPDNFFPNGMGSDRSGFVWQFGTGVEYNVTDATTLGFAYRFFKAPSIDRLIRWEGGEAFYEASGDNHAFMFTATTTID
jgi:opacity protein-like surface antigen